MEDFSFIENGLTYHVIATYYDKEYTKKNYILYTDNNFKDGKLQVFYSIYEEYPDKIIQTFEKLKKKMKMTSIKIWSIDRDLNHFQYIPN